MRNYPIVAILACISLFITASCSKNKSSSTALPAAYHMTAAVTKSSVPTLFTAIGPGYVTAVKNKNICTISGSDTSGKTAVSNFTFILDGWGYIGPYNIDSNSFSKAYYATSGITTTQTSFARGTVVINAISAGNVSGTFYGTLTDGSVITDGSFSAISIGF